MVLVNEWTLGIPDLIGFVGVALLIATYGAQQIGRLTADDPLYSILNGLAAVLITVSLFKDFNAVTLVIEIFWFAISVYGLVRALRSRRAKSAGQNAGLPAE